MAEKEIVKEMIQHQATPENFREEISTILLDTNYREQMIHEFENVKQLIGEENGSTKVAELIIEMLESD